MLTIKRLTSTTVQYTVSTRAPRKTIAAHIYSHGVILLRLIAGLLVTTSLLLEYRDSFPSIHNAAFSRLEDSIRASPWGQFASMSASNIDWIWRMLICAGVAWLVFRKGYMEESLLVIRGLGVQTSTSSPSYLWTGSTRFIPTSSIQDIFIHEAFKGFEVRFYLSIVIEGEEDVVVVFPVSVKFILPVLNMSLNTD